MHVKACMHKSSFCLLEMVTCGSADLLARFVTFSSYDIGFYNAILT